MGTRSRSCSKILGRGSIKVRLLDVKYSNHESKDSREVRPGEIDKSANI